MFFRGIQLSAGFMQKSDTMTSQGPFFPSTVANDSSVGSEVWSNAPNALTDDGSAAFYDAANGSSEILKLTGFGFSIPSGSTIAGIVAEVKRKRGSSSANMHDLLIQLCVGGVFTGDNKASGTRWPTVLTYAAYGSATDLWGLGLSASDINGANFGIGVQGSVDASSADDGHVDTVRLTVHYTPPAGGVFSCSTLNGLTCNGPKNFNRLG